MDWPFTTYTRPQRCRLLELPPELRELIFEYTLSSENPLVSFKLDEWQQVSYHEATQPPLTRANRQIRNESLPIFYGTNEIVLHTDGSKHDDTSAWLKCIERHLLKLTRLSLWVRYVTLTNMRPLASGAIRLRLKRTKRGSEEWCVEDGWRWITTTPPPSSVEGDGKFLVRLLGEMVEDPGYDWQAAEGFAAALVDLRMLYVKEKMS